MQLRSPATMTGLCVALRADIFSVALALVTWPGAGPPRLSSTTRRKAEAARAKVIMSAGARADSSFGAATASGSTMYERYRRMLRATATWGRAAQGAAQ